MRPIDADKISVDFAEILERDYVDDYARGFRAALVSVLKYETIAPPPNNPLTLEELREMDGETVWVTTSTGVRPFVGIVDTELNIVFFGLSSDTSYGGQVPLNCYGEFWLAYRRKPEERTS